MSGNIGANPVTPVRDQLIIDMYFFIRRCVSEDIRCSADELLPAVNKILARSKTIRIPLTQGHHVVIDSEDFHLARQYTWVFQQNANQASCYARASIGKNLCYWRKQQNPLAKDDMFLHQLIVASDLAIGSNFLGILPEEMVVDHINCNGLDDRRVNLHLVTSSYNSLKSNLVAVRLEGRYWYAYVPVKHLDTGLIRNLSRHVIQKNGVNVIQLKNQRYALRFGPYLSEEAAYAAYRMVCNVIHKVSYY